MLIDFEYPVHTIDAYSVKAFVEILNLVILSDDVTQLRRRLNLRDHECCYNLSGYYRWSFADHSFTLWQRIGFCRDECFKYKILEVKHISMICEDRVKPFSISN